MLQYATSFCWKRSSLDALPDSKPQRNHPCDDPAIKTQADGQPLCAAQTAMIAGRV